MNEIEKRISNYREIKEFYKEVEKFEKEIRTLEDELFKVRVDFHINLKVYTQLYEGVNNFDDYKEVIKIALEIDQNRDFERLFKLSNEILRLESIYTDFAYTILFINNKYGFDFIARGCPLQVSHNLKKALIKILSD